MWRIANHSSMLGLQRSLLLTDPYVMMYYDVEITEQLKASTE